VIVAIVALRKYSKRKLDDTVAEAIKSAGMIFLITGAGGSLGAMINATGIGKYLADTMQAWPISLIVLAFVFSQILRAAQGSTTVALVTTSAIMALMMATSHVAPVLVGLAICAGGIGMSLPNDSGFWVINRFGKFSINETLKAWTASGTITGLTALAVIMVLSLFTGILPGL